MRIEKIELIGFKSFADRTVFNLHPGITCIVGPNGCGKSNVVDSFKWVLGEQSAKSLRGDKMEEVIFNGSQSKKPKGMAEVSLSIVGLGNPTNGDSSEVTAVTRRLYRSGDSEYLINKDVCRLRDIKDIFLDTGLEVKSYSILEQDRISAVLNAKPEDRRFLIEEVAGVVKYKVRRAEALSKLQSSRLNLQRVKDIIAEVKRQINSLDRQVKKAERYKRLMEELRAIELRLAKRDYTGLKEALASVMAEQDGLKEREASLRAEISSTEAQLQSGRLSLLEREKLLEARQSELRAVEKELAEAERSLAVLKAERENLKEYTVRLRLQEEEAAEKLKEAERKKGEINARMAEISEEIESLREELKAGNESLGLKEDELLQREGLIDLKRKEAFSVSEELSNLRNELRMKEAFLEGLAKKEDYARAESAEVGRAIADAGAAIAALEEEKTRKAGELTALKQKREAAESEIADRRAEIEVRRVSLSAAREEFASVTSRLDSLKEMVQGGEPLRDVSALSTVSEAIDVPAEYERAVEAALREAVNAFILSSSSDVESAAGLLRDRESGKAALVPLDTPRLLKEKELPHGVIGRASELVRVKDEYSRLIKNMLSNVVVVRDLKTALGADDEFTYVTLDGDVVEPSGVVIAGKGRELLRMKRQIRELEAEAESTRLRISAIQAEMDGLGASLIEAEAAFQTLGPEILASEKSLHEFDVKGGSLSDEKARLERKLENLSVESIEAEKERNSVLEAIASMRVSVAEAEEGKRLIEAGIAELQDGLQAERERYEEQKDKTVDIRLLLGSLKERTDSMERELSSLDALKAELSEKSVLIAKEFSETEYRITAKEGEIAGKEESLKAVVLRASEMNAAISSERDSMAGESALVHSSEEKLKALRGGLDPVTGRLHELDVSGTEHRLRMENLSANIKTNYDVELETLEVEEPSFEDGERLEGVRRKIQELGPVSLGSIEEYEELRERYEFLSKQENDIEQSIAELEEAISKINATTRKKLRDAYDALNAKFSEVFSGLFGGGRAELRLTDENNILETGIDIVAQPPGKRLQNINLLSGGEKTLTALSLLFASFLIKPTPLCVLDEADAALDESNTEKFSKMLREISKDTQFVVITHNKVTMEAADYIYGITMEEAGASKVISLELVDAKAAL